MESNINDFTVTNANTSFTPIYFTSNEKETKHNDTG